MSRSPSTRRMRYAGQQPGPTPVSGFSANMRKAILYPSMRPTVLLSFV